MVVLDTSAAAANDTPVGTVYGALLNDERTLERLVGEFDQPPYKAPPVAPVLYIKPRNTFASDGAAVAIPAAPGKVRIDGTVGAVIGRRASRVKAAQALDYVSGYRLVSDLTVPHESYYRPSIQHRSRDGFCPMGDVLPATGFDLSGAELVIFVNGRMVLHRSFSTLHRSLAQLLEDVTEFMTLEVGDVLLVGPPEGAPLAGAGDEIRLEVAGLGQLVHTLVAEAPTTTQEFA